MMRAATKDGKVLIDGLQINTGEITYTQRCEESQRRDLSRPEEVLHPTWVAILGQKVGLNVVYMPFAKDY